MKPTWPVTESFFHLLKEGEANCIKDFIGMSHGEAWRIAYPVLRNRQEAEDVIQECYVKVWQQIGNVKDYRTFHGWFVKLIRNHALDRLRQSKRQDGTVGEIRGEHPAIPPADQPDQVFEREELMNTIRNLLPNLPDTQQTIFILRDLSELSIREVMLETGLTEASVKSNLYLARKALREKIRGIR